jgi:hypothetical protein
MIIVLPERSRVFVWSVIGIVFAIDLGLPRGETAYGRQADFVAGVWRCWRLTLFRQVEQGRRARPRLKQTDERSFAGPMPDQTQGMASDGTRMFFS